MFIFRAYYFLKKSYQSIKKRNNSKEKWLKECEQILQTVKNRGAEWLALHMTNILSPGIRERHRPAVPTRAPHQHVPQDTWACSQQPGLKSRKLETDQQPSTNSETHNAY